MCSSSSGHTVDAQRAVPDNLLDNSLLLQVGQTPAGNGSVDLHSVDENSDGDQTVCLDILIELVGSGLVEDDGVLGLVLDYNEISSANDFIMIASVTTLCRGAEGMGWQCTNPFPSTTSS